MSLRLISSSLCNVARETRASTHKDRLEHGDRRENSSPPDLDYDVEQLCFHSFGRVFVGNRPPRRFRGEPEPLALLERIHFDDRAVGLIGKTAANLIEVANCVQNFVDRIGQPPIARCVAAPIS